MVYGKSSLGVPFLLSFTVRHQTIRLLGGLLTSDLRLTPSLARVLGQNLDKEKRRLCSSVLFVVEEVVEDHHRDRRVAVPTASRPLL